MSNQAQCPNCGGYKVSTQNKTVIAVEEQRRTRNWLMPIIFFGVMTVWITISGLSVSVVGGVGCGGIFLLFSALLLYYEWKNENKKGGYIIRVPTIVKYDYYCDLCGYSWSWQSDDPLPEVHIRPDLIANGAQKLEQEEEQRRKDAAALYYLTHQGKK